MVHFKNNYCLYFSLIESDGRFSWIFPANIMHYFKSLNSILRVLIFSYEIIFKVDKMQQKISFRNINENDSPKNKWPIKWTYKSAKKWHQITRTEAGNDLSLSQSRLYHEVWRDSESWNDSTKFQAVDQRKLRWSLYVCVCVCNSRMSRFSSKPLCTSSLDHPWPLTGDPLMGMFHQSSRVDERKRAARLFSSGNFQYLACLFIRPGKWKSPFFSRGNSSGR